MPKWVSTAFAAFFFLLPVVYSNYFVEPGNIPRWLLAAAVLPTLLLFTEFRAGKAHWWGFGFLIWMAFTCSLAVAPLPSLDRLWKMILAGIVFCLASALNEKEYRACLLAFGAGMVVNSGIAFASWMAWIPTIPAEDLWSRPGIFTATLGTIPGLMVNSNYLAGAAALTLVPLLAMRRVREGIVALFVIPCALLAVSKAAFLAAGTAIAAALWRKSRWAAIGFCMIGAGVFVGYLAHLGKDYKGDSWLFHQKVESRTVLFANTVSGIDIIGHGPGSFWTEYPLYANRWLPASAAEYGFDKRPRTAHNDFLTIAFEGGLIGLALYAMMVVSLLRRKLESKEDLAAWLGFVTFLGLGLVDFPAFLPHSLFFGMLHAGFLARPIERPS